MQDTDSFLQYSGFKLIKNENPFLITIERKVGDLTVQVHFESQAPETEDMEETEEMEQYSEYQEMMDESVHDITVNIFRGTKDGPGIIAELAIHGEELFIILMGKVDNVKVSIQKYSYY